MKRATNLPAEFARRRNKILGRIAQMKNDVDHWNAAHPNEEPIVIDFDLSKDVERLRAAVAENDTATK